MEEFESYRIHTTINPNDTEHLGEKVTQYMRTDFPRLNDSLTVEMALRVIRSEGVGERIVYFYVLNEDERLIGIVPTRGLLTSMPRVRIADIMLKQSLISVSEETTVLEVCKMFVEYKLLALPILDDEGRMIGVIDAGIFTEDELTFAHRHHFDDIFQMIGFGISEIKGKSAFGRFRFRFPWLMATMLSGITCAVLTGMYATTLAQALVLAFFMTLVLALGESVSIQSMTVALQNLHLGKPTWSGYFTWIRREIAATFLMGIACALIVGAIAFAWQGDLMAAAVIALTINLSVITAGVIGVSIPTLLHAIHEESKIASGPLTLAAADIVTIILYFNVALLIF